MLVPFLTAASFALSINSKPKTTSIAHHAHNITMPEVHIDHFLFLLHQSPVTSHPLFLTAIFSIRIPKLPAVQVLPSLSTTSISCSGPIECLGTLGCRHRLQLQTELDVPGLFLQLCSSSFSLDRYSCFRYPI